jgi:hypothetical protein
MKSYFLLFSINSFFFKYKVFKLSEPDFNISLFDVNIDEDSSVLLLLLLFD